MVILIDNGHGCNTQGKCSPDKKFKEFSSNRELAKRIEQRLRSLGFNAERIVTEENDISLGERCRRVNKICDKVGKKNVIFISVHSDAAGSGGKWLKAGGWSAYTSRGKTESDRLATFLYESAKKHLASYAERMEQGKKAGYYDSKQRPLRTDYSDGDADKEADFYVLKNTKCPAVLTENLFYDNVSDLAFLTSEEGKKAIVELHVEGIVNYIMSL